MSYTDLTYCRSHMNLISSIKHLLFVALLSLPYSVTAAEIPNPQLMGRDGQQHHLKDYLAKDKWTTIIVWGPKCPSCIEEMPEIQGLYDDIEKVNINVLGLAVDFPSFTYAKLKQVQQFEEDYFITFPNLLISSDIYYELGLGPLKGTPTIILINPKGKVSAVQVGGVPGSVIEKYVAEEDAKAKLVSKN